MVVAIRRVILRPRVSARYKTFLAQLFDKDKWPPFPTSSVLSLAWTIPFATPLITEEVTGALLNLRALIVSIVFFIRVSRSKVGLPLLFMTIPSERSAPFCLPSL